MMVNIHKYVASLENQDGTAVEQDVSKVETSVKDDHELVQDLKKDNDASATIENETVKTDTDIISAEEHEETAHAADKSAVIVEEVVPEETVVEESIPEPLATTSVEEGEEAVKVAEAEIAEEIGTISEGGKEVLDSTTEIIEAAQDAADDTELVPVAEAPGETAVELTPTEETPLGDETPPPAPLSEELPAGDEPVSSTMDTLPDEVLDAGEVVSEAVPGIDDDVTPEEAGAEQTTADESSNDEPDVEITETEEVDVTEPAVADAETEVVETVEDTPDTTDSEVAEVVETESESIPAEAEPDEIVAVDEEVAVTDSIVEEAAETAEVAEDGLSELEEVRDEAEEELTNDDSDSTDVLINEAETEETVAETETASTIAEPTIEEGAIEDDSETIVAETDDDVSEDDIEEKLAEGEIDIPDVDVEVTEDDVEEADEAADEAVEEADKLEDDIEDSKKTIGQLLEEQASNESMLEILHYGLEHKQYSPQFIVHANSCLERLHNAFDVYSPGIPAMEDYGYGNLEDYYKAMVTSLESFNSTIGKFVRNIIDNIAEGANASIHVKANQKELAAANTKADQLLVKLKDTDNFESKEIKINGILKGDDNLVRGVAGEVRRISDIINKCFKIDGEYIERLVGHLATAIEADSEEAIDKALEEATKLEVPVKKYPESAFISGKLDGSFVFERSGRDVTGRTSKDIERLAAIALPTGEWGATGTGTAKVNRKDVTELMKLSKVLIGLGNASLKVSGNRGVRRLDQANRDISKVASMDSKAGKKKVRQLAGAVWEVVGQSAENHTILVDYIVALTNAINTAVNRAIK
ncbi:hypothetical protein [Pseudomonas phage U1B]|nr:hypothetical protein [Pseudomonas phage T2P]QYV99281.1 hypothetical protein [Pseudomonas phage U1B]QYV99737.1 hypothetical protein [Pseudomonas phage U5]